MTTVDVVQETKEERIAIAKSHARTIKAGMRLEESGISLAAVAKLANISTGEFTQLCSSMTLSQSTLLRDYLKSLLDLAQMEKCGEVLLATVCTDTIRIVLKNSGQVSFLHDLINVVVAMKVFESSVEAKKKSNLIEDLQEIRELETKFEQCAAKMSKKIIE